MGKTPLLPIFAMTLGATDAFLGFIVSVSTLTGMVLKPAIGILSDRWGRRWWLIAGTVFFAGMPFLYRFVHTPAELFSIRIIHGLATAIYGPVTLAFVAEGVKDRLAEKLGWFGMARSAGYIVGPAAAGWLFGNRSESCQCFYHHWAVQLPRLCPDSITLRTCATRQSCPPSNWSADCPCPKVGHTYAFCLAIGWTRSNCVYCALRRQSIPTYLCPFYGD